MSKVFIEESTLDDIANAIQEQEGSEEKIPTAEMAARIKALGGAVEYTTGTLTFGVNYQGKTIPHGLSKAPKLFYLYWENFDKSTSVRLTFAIYSPKHGSVWYGGSTEVAISGGRPTIPGVYADPYSAISADGTNVNITATARQWEAGNWIWEAWTW